MTANIDTKTGIAYGYISANALHPDTVNELQMGGTDVYYEDAKKEEYAEVARNPEARLQVAEALGKPVDELEDDEVLQYIESNWDGSSWEMHFNDNYSPDEPIHEGEKDGVRYRTSWLGGALNVWVFESPHLTNKAGRASPCVPNAGILDKLDGDVFAYDVPPEWRRQSVFVGFTEEEIALLKAEVELVSKGTYAYLFEDWELTNEDEDDATLILARGYTITKYRREDEEDYLYRVDWSHCISPPSRDEPAQYDTEMLGDQLTSINTALACVVGSEFLAALALRQEWDRDPDHI